MMLLVYRGVLRGPVRVLCPSLMCLVTTVLCSVTLGSGPPLVKIGSTTAQYDNATTTLLMTLNTGVIVEPGNSSKMGETEKVSWEASDVRREPLGGLTLRQDSRGAHLPPPGRLSDLTAGTGHGSTRDEIRVTNSFTPNNITDIYLERTTPLAMDHDATDDSPAVGKKGKGPKNSTQSHRTSVSHEDEQSQNSEKEPDTAVAGEEAAAGSAAWLGATEHQPLISIALGPPEPAFSNAETWERISEKEICFTEDCGLEKSLRSEGKQSGTYTSAARSETIAGNPTLSVSVLMPPTDDYFYLSSSTLQDLWQNHINAAAAVPMEIVETSASDLMEYYLPPPDSRFVVPLMTGWSQGSEAFTSPTAPTRLATGPVLQRPQQTGPSPTATPPLSPLAGSSSTVAQVLPPPSLPTDPSIVLYGSLPPSVYRTPSKVPREQTLQTSDIGVSSQAHFPDLANQSNLPIFLVDISGMLPPHFVVKGPGGVPAPVVNEATSGALPGLHSHGPDQKVPHISGGHIRFLGQEFPRTPQNSGNERPMWTDSTAVRVTPHGEGDDPGGGGVRPESEDTRLLIRIKASDAVAATQPDASSQGNDQGYPKINLGDGHRISIRVKGSPEVSLPTKHSQTPPTQHQSSQTLQPQSLPPTPRPSLSLQPQTQPPQGRKPQIQPSQRLPPSSDHPRNQPQHVPQAVTPSSMMVRPPEGGHPADDRLSVSDPTPPDSDLGNIKHQLNQGGTGGHYSTGGMGDKGSLTNKGGSGSLAGLINKVSFDGIKGQLNKGLGRLEGLLSKGGLRGIRGQFNKSIRKVEDFFNKGGLGQLHNGDLASQITNSVNQVNHELQKLVDPLQTKVESSFTSAVDFLEMFFGHVLPTDYYDKILTVLAIIAFLAFVHVRISLMVSSLAQTPVALSVFQKTSEFFKTLEENEQLQVIYELAKDVHVSIERWTEAQLSLPTFLTSKIPFMGSVLHIFGSSDAKDDTISSDSIFSQKTLFVPDTNISHVLPHDTPRLSIPGMSQLPDTLEAAHSNPEAAPSTPETAPITNGTLVGEVEELARLGASLVDLTLEQGRRRWPPSGATCLQRPLCDLITYSNTGGGLSGFVFPFVSAGAAWLAGPPHDVFTFLDTFRSLWLAASTDPQAGCPRIHTCGSHIWPAQ